VHAVDGSRFDDDTGSGPAGVACDGISISITNAGSETMSKRLPG
jgi:hypothetical protein